jgi:hypothetical protein
LVGFARDGVVDLRLDAFEFGVLDEFQDQVLAAAHVR